LNNLEFIEWLRGFTDGEGSFIITINKYENSEGKISNSLNFRYVIFLHKDDTLLLNEVRERLSIGTVKVYDRFVKFQVSKSSEIEKIIEIFSLNPLNTSKHLNFLEFKKAYNLYHNRLANDISNKNLEKLEIYEEILKIKNTMNRKRIHFKLPNDHCIKISPYWLLGFVEGEGSFSIARKNYFSLELGITQTLSEKKVMSEIKQFLLNLPGNYRIRSKLSNVVALNEDKKAKNENSNLVVKIQISDSDYIKNVIIPFFDNLIWLSKKRLDYLDWKTVLNLKSEGKHYLPEGKEIILSICNRMNQNRLSTNIKESGEITKKSSNTEKDNLEIRLKSLLNSPSNLEFHSNGKIYIKSLNKYLKGRGNVGLEVFNNKGILIKCFDSILECAIFFKVHSRTIIRRLDSGNKFEFENEIYTLKRKV
jgi:LAGLIDADG endonuclease